MKMSRSKHTLIPVEQEDGSVTLQRKPERLIAETVMVKLPVFNREGKMIVGNDDHVHMGVPVKCKMEEQPVMRYKLNPLYAEVELNENGHFKRLKQFDFTNDGRRFELPDTARILDGSVEHPTNMQDARTIATMKQNEALLQTNTDLKVQVDELANLVRQMIEANGKKEEPVVAVAAPVLKEEEKTVLQKFIDKLGIDNVKNLLNIATGDSKPADTNKQEAPGGEKKTV